MRVYLIFDKEIYPIDENAVVDTGVKAWFNDDLENAINKLKRKNFKKPDAIVLDGESFKQNTRIDLNLMREKLGTIREICPDAEIIFLYAGMLSISFKKAMSAINVSNIIKKKFDVISFCKIIQDVSEKDTKQGSTSNIIPSENEASINTDESEYSQDEECKAVGTSSNDIDVESCHSNADNVNHIIYSDTNVEKDTNTKKHHSDTTLKAKTQIRVLQADGYTKFTEPLRTLKDVVLVGIASKREEVIEKCKTLQPDVVILSPDIEGDTDMLEIVDKISGKVRIIFVNPSKLPQIDRRMLLEYNVEFLDYLTIGALEFQIKKSSSLQFDDKKVAYENVLPDSTLKYGKIPNLIVVASAKSVGKTMVAVNLAVKLAEAGNLTVLIDLTEDQDINVWLKVGGNKDGLLKVFRGAGNIEKIAWIPSKLNIDNLMVLTGDSSVYRITYERKGLGTVLKKLSDFADYVVVDLPNGFQTIQSDVTISSAGRVFFLTDTGPARLEKTVNALNSLTKRYAKPDKFTVILNNVADDYTEPITYIKQNTGMDVSFILPSRPKEMNESIKDGEPICLYNPEFSNKFTEICDFIEDNI